MKDNNYILIQGWMVNRLNLSGNELMVYAVIYGFSQDEESKYEGSGRYISDSLRISRRAVTSILDNLVKKGFLKKYDRFERNLKFCDYQADPEFFPKKDNNGGMENSSIGRKNLPKGGMEDSSIGRKNLPKGMEDSSIGGMEDSANHITNSYINNKTTTTSDSPESPDLTAKPPPENKKPAAEVLSPEKIKQAILAIDRTLLLKTDFYSRAAAFMSLNYLDVKYIAWLYKQVELRNPGNFDGFFFTLFFAENMVEKYKIQKQPEEPPPPLEFKCPVCGAVHDLDDESCPSCGLPQNPLPDTVLIYKQLRNFPPEKRNEYFRRESDIFSSCASTDFLKIKEKRVSLYKEFGIKVNDEEPSVSYHP